MKRAFVLWTGGKDSCLALHMAIAGGFEVAALVTFVPEDEAFKAHPIGMMTKQAGSLGLLHLKVPVTPPYQDSYRKALMGTAADLSADTVVTGDIERMNGQPNWIRECCDGTELKVLRPLWRMPREDVFKRLFAEKIMAEVSYINDDRLPGNWLGRIIDQNFYRELKAVCERHGLDPCGENGEYHTMVVDSPLFSNAVG